ncbi:MAG: hypothetical protein IT440_03835 [Phycisphaeraceae bacterium]|nr:hypothetical protein [Phycisphaeraceae bacterium]
MELPWIKGTFQHILHPPGRRDAHAAGDTSPWYVNDHCFFVDVDNRIHWFGITNPYPEDKKKLYGPGSHRHIGHAVASYPFGPWEEKPHAFALPADTLENIGACFAVRIDGEYRLIYGYNKGHSFGRSTDLNTWSRMDQPALDMGPGTRDPCLLLLDDGTYLLYSAAGHNGISAVVLAESKDLVHWSMREPAMLTDIRCEWGAMESPFVHRRGDDYYLFLNHSHRQYEETLVFHSRNPRHFDWNKPLCTLFAHAAEMFEWNGKTYISHCGIEDRHWDDVGAPYGLWLAELGWMPLS